MNDFDSGKASTWVSTVYQGLWLRHKAQFHPNLRTQSFLMNLLF